MITTISLKYASKKMVPKEGVVAYTLQIYQNILSFEILTTGDDFPSFRKLYLYNIHLHMKEEKHIKTSPKLKTK